MLYLKKLGLVLLLTIACVAWLPLLALRGLLAGFNAGGRRIYKGLESKDSGIKVTCAIGLIVVGLPWAAAILVIMALAMYEIACFKLMKALFAAEDIGWREKTEPAPTGPQGPRYVNTVAESSGGKVHKLPTANALMSVPQAIAATRKALGYDLTERGFTWSSQHQCKAKQGTAAAVHGTRLAWVKNGQIVDVA